MCAICGKRVWCLVLEVTEWGLVSSCFDFLSLGNQVCLWRPLLKGCAVFTESVIGQRFSPFWVGHGGQVFCHCNCLVTRSVCFDIWLILSNAPNSFLLICFCLMWWLLCYGQNPRTRGLFFWMELSVGEGSVTLRSLLNLNNNNWISFIFCSACIIRFFLLWTLRMDLEFCQQNLNLMFVQFYQISGRQISQPQSAMGPMNANVAVGLHT